MELKEFLKTNNQVFEAIEESIASQRLTSALILVYSAMESFCGSIELSKPGRRKLFTDWVNHWMLRKYPLPCNETDLYFEKNRILNCDDDSEFSDHPEAREIYYVSGNADLQFLQSLLEQTGKSEYAVGVKIEDLINSFRNGLNDYLKNVDSEDQQSKMYEKEKKDYAVSIV